LFHCVTTNAPTRLAYSIIATVDSPVFGQAFTAPTDPGSASAAFKADISRLGSLL
jgi:hypothetical protein